MKRDRFFTKVDDFSLDLSIDYSDKVMFMGSCYAEKIGGKMSRLKYSTIVNPYGVVFNPIPLSNLLKRLVERKMIDASDLDVHQGLYFSYADHSEFSRTEPMEVVSNINESTKEAAEFLNSAKVLVLTFGSAWAYFHKKRGVYVANCHKVPQQEFEKVLLKPEFLLETWMNTLDEVRNYNPELKIILTVSPVRHWKDGSVENQRSKSLLNVLAHQLCENVDGVYYFPAYEMMMDELRDYRFYESDLVHPSTLAVEIIWERFASRVFTQKELEIHSLLEKIEASVNHKPMNQRKEELERLKQFGLTAIEKIHAINPAIDLSREKEYFLLLCADIES
jgi:hypothetical protein